MSRSRLGVVAFAVGTFLNAIALAQEQSSDHDEASGAEDAALDEQSTADRPDERLKNLEATVASQTRRLEHQDRKLSELAIAVEHAEERAAVAEERAMTALSDKVGELEEERTKLRFYGFADMAFKKRYISETSPLSELANDNATFAVGNVNLYIDAQPLDVVRVLSEVRFTLFPHGSPDSDLAPADLRVHDTSSATGSN